MNNGEWHKSSFSGNSGQCVEVLQECDQRAVRDSKSPGGPQLVFTAAEWEAFILGVKAGEFD